RDALAGCPEWWVLGLGTIAWLATVSHGLSNWGHYGHRDPTVGTGILHWQIMVMAMMLPVIAYQARTVAQRCFAERRHDAIAAFVLGYITFTRTSDGDGLWPRASHRPRRSQTRMGLHDQRPLGWDLLCR